MGRPAFLLRVNRMKVFSKLKEEFFKILPPTIYFFVALHLHVYSVLLLRESKSRHLFNFNRRRRPHSRQGGVARGHVADNQSISEQTADSQHRLENRDLSIAFLSFTIWNAGRVLAEDWRFRQPIRSCFQKPFGRISGPSRSFYSCSLPSIARYMNWHASSGNSNIFRAMPPRSDGERTLLIKQRFRFCGICSTTKVPYSGLRLLADIIALPLFTVRVSRGLGRTTTFNPGP